MHNLNKLLLFLSLCRLSYIWGHQLYDLVDHCLRITTSMCYYFIVWKKKLRENLGVQKFKLNFSRLGQLASHISCFLHKLGNIIFFCLFFFFRPFITLFETISSSFQHFGHFWLFSGQICWSKKFIRNKTFKKLVWPRFKTKNLGHSAKRIYKILLTDLNKSKLKLNNKIKKYFSWSWEKWVNLS